MTIVHLNGQFCPLEHASVSVMDRGFLFGDGVYEVVPVYDRKPFRLAEHLQRLADSLDKVRITNPHSQDEWRDLVLEMIARNDAEDQSIYIQLTRGAAPVRNHAFPEPTVAPTVFMMSEPLPMPTEAQLKQGVTAVSATDIRWQRCDIKGSSLLANCLLKQQATDNAAAETVLFRDGFLTEGAASNIFVVHQGTILAPQKNHHMLSGITYDVVLELAAEHGIPFSVLDITEEQTRSADELWLSSSTKEILAIVTLDGQPIGNGQPGPIYQHMSALYQHFKRAVMRA